MVVNNLTGLNQPEGKTVVIVFQYIQGCCSLQKCCDTVDRRNPANQLRLVVYPTILPGFIYTSQVVQDFFRQQLLEKMP